MSFFRGALRRFGLKDRALALFFSGESWAGKPVTPNSALQLATFWACVRLISQTVATLPLSVYRRRPDGGRDRDASHSLHSILHDMPNADMTAVEFWEAMTAHLLLWGNAFASIDRGVTGGIVALNLLKPTQIQVERDRQGVLRYRYTTEREVIEFDEADVLHIRGFGLGGDLGLSPVEYARQTLGGAMAADEASARMFANGMRPGGILSYEGASLLTPEQRAQAKKALIDPISGSENSGKTLLMEGAAGFKWQSVDINPRDAEMLLTRRHNIEEICRWFGVPPVLIGHSADGQTMWGSGVEQIMLGWLTLGLQPYLTRIEQAIKRSLLTPAERATLYAEFTVEGLLRADSAGRGELYSKLMNVGAITPNQIADRENLPRFEGGDRHFVNSTLVPIDQAGVRPARVQPAPGEAIPEA